MKSVSNYTEAARALVYNPSDYVNAYVLAGGVVDTITVPSGATVASFSATGNFYANFNGGTAAVPSADVTNGTASTLNPTVRYVGGIASISIIAPAACVVTVSFYNE